MSPKSAVLRAAVLKLLQDKVKTARDEANSAALSGMDPGDRINAVYAGEKLAAVSATEGRQSARVADPERFARWVAENYPTEVEYKPVVREAFVNAVRDASKQAGEACAPDGTLDVPGITVGQGDPYITVRTTSDAERIVADMVAAGVLALDGTLHELPRGEAA